MPDTLARMRQLIGTSAEWNANNLIIGLGELAIEVSGSGYNIKIGDGTTAFNELPYSGGPALSVAWGNITGKPATFPPSTHTHSIGQIVGLTDINGKINYALLPDTVKERLDWKGSHTPTGGLEYPAGPVAGDVWGILGASYTFIGGNLAGKRVSEGAAIVYDNARWNILGGDFVKVADLVAATTGLPMAGKVPRLDATGRLDPSFVSVTGGLHFRGLADPTAAAPAGAMQGDYWLASVAGTAHASWIGIAGAAIALNAQLIWNGAAWAHLPAAAPVTGFVPLDGSVAMVGPLTLSANPTPAPAHAVRQDELDARVDGVLQQVATVAALAALAEDYPAVMLRGYTTSGDGGGGMLTHDAASVLPIDNALVFPAITGRYTRPVDGILHSKWFGLRHDNVADQSVRLQQFLWTLCEPQEKQYRGFLDAGVHNCDGAVLHWKRNDGVAHQMAGWLDGSSRRLSIIRNATLAVGAAPWYTAAASVANITNIRVEGYVDIWNCEGNSFFENFSVTRAPLETFDRNYGVVKGAWATATVYVKGDSVTDSGKTYIAILDHTSTTLAADVTAKKWLELTDFFGYMLNLYVCNHPLFINLGIDGHVGHADYKKGTNCRGVGNARFLQGTTYGCSTPAFELSQAGTAMIHIDGHKFEGCTGTMIWDRSAGANIIRSFPRMGPEHDHVSPMVRLGESGVASPDGTTLRQCYFADDNLGTLTGTALKLELCNGVIVDECTFRAFAVGIDLGLGPAVSDVDIGKSNQFQGTVTPILRNIAANMARPHATMAAPLILADAGAINWNVLRGEVMQVTIGGARVMNAPSNIRAGDRYRMFLKKSTAPANFTSWNAVFHWNGTAPTFAAMTTTQHAEITMDGVDFGAGVILSCNYEIRG